jgi:hypothetical protein
MRSLIFCCCVAVLAGCAKPEQQAAKDSTEAAMAAGATPAPISLASLAGKWSVSATAAGSDSVLTSFEMVATGDASGWTFNFPGRAPVPLRVIAVEGDSIVTEAGPYESVLRNGVQVSVHTVMRLEDGKLIGDGVAHYSTTGADSVLSLHTEGTREP